MQTAVINFTTEEQTKKEAQKVASQLGISLSTVLNKLLKEFIKTKTVVFRADEDEIPNASTQAILQQAEEDIKKGQNLSPKFRNAKDMIAYLHEQTDE